MKQYLPVLILGCLSLTAWYLGLYHYLSFDVLLAHHEKIDAYITLYPMASALFYMGVYIVIVGLSIPGATFLTLVGGLLFGQLVGTCCVVLSATIGATILFISARLASQDILWQRAGPWVEKMKRGFQEDAFFYLLTIRLIPIFPFVAINLVAAVLQIPLKTFIITTFIGIIPGTFIYVSIGDALKDALLSPVFTPKIVLEPKLLLALAGLGILCLLPVFYKRLSKR